MLIEQPNFKFSVLLHTEYQCHPVYIWWLCGKESTCIARDVGSIPGLGRALEKEMATHPKILAWEIP